MLYTGMVQSFSVAQQLDFKDTKPVREKSAFQEISCRIIDTQIFASLAFIACEVWLTFSYGLCQATSTLGLLPMVYSVWLFVKVTLDSINLVVGHHSIWTYGTIQIITFLLGIAAIFEEVRAAGDGTVTHLNNNVHLRLFAWAIILLAQLFLIMTSFFVLAFYFHVVTMNLPLLKTLTQKQYVNPIIHDSQPDVVVIKTISKSARN